MKVIITGGAGFIGSNAATRYLARGDEVVVVDDLSRPGVERNLDWLKAQGGKLTFLKVDIRDGRRTQDVFAEHQNTDLVLHLAGQVAVTTSVIDPRTDFDINASGTLNVLEGVRLAKITAPFIFSSTNKVYGGMEDATVIERGGRYGYEHLTEGISEERPLDFHSPYGCSKGAADQYVRDYHRIYQLNTVVLRQSCIYGYRQFGAEDQGWVAWFMIAAQLGRPITVFGDGKQVRDILFVDDLLDAFESAATRIKDVAGRVYNIGGGPANVLSLHELLRYIAERTGKKSVPHGMAGWRPGDQRVYVSDIRKAKRELNWSPRVNATQGLDQLYDWVSANTQLFQ